MKQKAGRFVYWTPRIVSILFILFLAMFSLDIFEPGRGFWQIALGLFMHNIPVFILTALLVIAWKREIIGAITFFTAGLLYVIFVMAAAIRGGFEWYYIAWVAQIAVPAFMLGVLFLIGWRRKRKKL